MRWDRCKWDLVSIREKQPIVYHQIIPKVGTVETPAVPKQTKHGKPRRKQRDRRRYCTLPESVLEERVREAACAMPEILPRQKIPRDLATFACLLFCLFAPSTKAVGVHLFTCCECRACVKESKTTVPELCSVTESSRQYDVRGGCYKAGTQSRHCRTRVKGS